MVSALKHSITHKLHRAEEWIFANPKLVLAMVLAMTLVFAGALPKLRVYSDFADLLPQNHPYIQVYNRLKENFGGANMIVMAIEVERGTIFNNETLALIHEATQGVDSLPSVNHNLVGSLTHRTSRKIFVDEYGGFQSESYYDPLNGTLSVAQLEQIKQDVIANPTMYGLLVSPDLKAALIKAQLNESDLDYKATFDALQRVRHELEKPGHRIYVTGNPVLTGWVYTYINQIVEILAWTMALLATLLIIYYRRFYGITLPLLGIALSSIWGLGFMAMMGINLEPLSLPIPFLIAARATSHGVQLVARYYEELAIVKNGQKAARNALDALFRPGSLAIIVDAIGIAVLVLGAAPFNHKLGIAAGFWGFSVIFTVHFMVPLALSVLPQPATTENANQGVRDFLGQVMAKTGGTDGGARSILLLTVIGAIGALHFRLQGTARRVRAGLAAVAPHSRLQRVDDGDQRALPRLRGTARVGAHRGEGRHQAPGGDGGDRALPGAHAERPDPRRHQGDPGRGAGGEQADPQRRPALDADSRYPA